jgi:trans-2,3-dihydro-3-hydroxyanthranilate isomerase
LLGSGVLVFPLALGIAEDPATGSGTGCLAAYLARHRFLGSDRVDICVGQGNEIGWPLVMQIRYKKRDDGYVIEAGGRVLPIAEGLWG